MTTKVCTKCGEEKSLSEYHNSKAKYHKDGHKIICKICYVKYAPGWRKKNPQKVKDYSKKYHQENKNKLCEKVRIYYHEHKEERKEYMSWWRPQNKEHISESHKLYRVRRLAENPQFDKEGYERRKIINPKFYKDDYLRNRDKLIIIAAKWREENRDKLKERDRQNMEQLTDQYVISQICKRTKLTFSDIRQYPVLIECQRLLILTKRELKKQVS